MQSPANRSSSCPPTAPQVLRPSWYTQSAPCTCSAHCQSMLIWQNIFPLHIGRIIVQRLEWVHLPLSGHLSWIAVKERGGLAFSVPVCERRRRGINVWGLVCTTTLAQASESRTSMLLATPQPKAWGPKLKFEPLRCSCVYPVWMQQEATKEHWSRAKSSCGLTKLRWCLIWFVNVLVF